MNNIFKETQKRERVNYDVAALVARDVQKTKLREMGRAMIAPDGKLQYLRFVHID